jgi:outer membrane protein TolC
MIAAVSALAAPHSAHAQRATVASLATAGRDSRGADAGALDSLIAHALSHSPSIRAARARLDAARSRVAPAGLRPDPMLMIGVQNLPVGDPGFDDEMTMKMFGIGQTIPYPGKLALSRRIAERGVEAAEAALERTRRTIVREMRSAYYELAFLDLALEIAHRNRDVLIGLIEVTEARYGAGTGGQQDVLKARVESGRLAETAVGLSERRRATLSRLNAVLDRPSDSPIAGPVIPRRVARAAVADSASEVRFASPDFGARAADSPIPPLEQLQTMALRQSPMLREAEAMIAVQAARAELASRAALPDFDVALQYGQRTGYPDMVTATVSIPLPLQKRRKQDAQLAEMTAELRAAEAEHYAHQNDVRAEVARLHSELERDRAQLALYVKSIIPQGRASLASAMSSFQVARLELLTVLDNQATLFNYEMEYVRLLSDFATTLAELEQVVGQEVIP